MELHEFKQVDLNAGCPPESMEDSQWQEYFGAMRLLVVPYGEKKMKTNGVEFIENGISVNGRKSVRESQWYYYCQFINSILSSIRKGQTDFCFNIYHITELLKFERDRLRTRWIRENRCFEVWLES